MVEEVVLAYRTHVGVDTFVHVTFELLQRPAFPLRGRLHDRCADRLLQAKAAGKLDRSPRTVAIQHVVHARGGLNNQRHLNHHQVQFLREPFFDVLLDVVNSLLRTLDVQEGRIVPRQYLLHGLIGADSRAGQVGSLV